LSICDYASTTDDEGHAATLLGPLLDARNGNSEEQDNQSEQNRC